MEACKVWTGTFSKDGRPRVWLGGRWQDARRLAFERLGVRLDAGLRVEALCSDVRCVEPTHLFASVRPVRKPRTSRGIRCLSAEMQDFARKSPLSTRSIAALLGVSQTTVCRVRKLG